MISCILLLIKAINGHRSPNDKCTCYYTGNATSCNTDCQQQLVENDRLYRCPSERFQQAYPLWKWILAEIFCIDKDNRDQVAENYQPSSTIDYDTPPSININDDSSTTESENSMEYGSSIMITNSNINQPFIYPSMSLFSSVCGKKKEAKFLIPSSATCYYEINTKSQSLVDDFINIVNGSTNIAQSNVFFNVNFIGYNAPDNNGNSSSTIPDTNSSSTGNTSAPLINASTVKLADTRASIQNGVYVSSVTVQFYVEDMVITQANVIIEQKQYNNERILPFTVSVDYITQNQNRNRMKSGNFGYAYGQPVIALQTGSKEEEPFPIPFGLGNNTNYTPLLFGIDSISGFSNISIDYYSNLKISKLGQGNPAYENDWVPVFTRPTEVTDIYTLNIFYWYIGNINNPQKMIRYAYLEMPIDQQSSRLSQKIFKCSFLKISENPSHRYLQPNPKVIPVSPISKYPFTEIR